MTHRDSERFFLNQVRTALDADVKNLDASTRSRLNRMRQAALDAGSTNNKRRIRILQRGLAAALASAAVILSVYFIGYRPAVEMAFGPPTEDLEIIVAEDNLEFYEDLDFYAWLAEVEDDNV